MFSTHYTALTFLLLRYMASGPPEMLSLYARWPVHRCWEEKCRAALSDFVILDVTLWAAVLQACEGIRTTTQDHHYSEHYNIHGTLKHSLNTELWIEFISVWTSVYIFQYLSVKITDVFSVSFASFMCSLHSRSVPPFSRQQDTHLCLERGHLFWLQCSNRIVAGIGHSMLTHHMCLIRMEINSFLLIVMESN